MPSTSSAGRAPSRTGSGIGALVAVLLVAVLTGAAWAVGLRAYADDYCDADAAGGRGVARVVPPMSVECTYASGPPVRSTDVVPAAWTGVLLATGAGAGVLLWTTVRRRD